MRSLILVAVLSLFLFKLGQIYNGEVFKGVILAWHNLSTPR
jgi:TM2 domain-containing membrane protein YozV